jgi:hypothetical protein
MKNAVSDRFMCSDPFARLRPQSVYTLLTASARLLCALLLSGAGSQAQTQTLLPAWRTDLRSAIADEPIRVESGIKSETLGRAASSLFFLNDETVVLTFVVHHSETKPELAHRGSLDNHLSLRLRVMVLDANTGTMVKTVDLPTESRSSRLIAAPASKLITLRGDELTLFDSDISVLKSLRLPPAGIIGWLPHISPTGKNILLSSGELRSSSWIWVESETLKILATWEDNPTGYIRISDQKLATSTCWWGHVCNITLNENGAGGCVAGPKCDAKVEIADLSRNWSIVGPGEPYLAPKFANEDILFLPGKTTGRFVRPDGTLALEEPRGQRSWGCWETGLLSAANGKRFVIPSCGVKGAHPSLDISGHSILNQVFVYDIGSDSIRSLPLGVKGPKIEDDMLFAISPDGLRLAILNNRHVEVLALPPAP